jgi:5'-nucleotidase / UDP-sugar diphosphatase
MRKLNWFYVSMALILALMLLLISCTGNPSSTSHDRTAPYHLTILHTSENHGHWEAVEVSKVSQGGITRRATLVKKLRTEVANTLLLDSGDVSQGTLYNYVYRGAEGRDFYNLLGYDAVVPGNHEFDPGVKLLADNLLSGAQFSVVLANMDFSGEPLLAGWIPPFVIKTIGGEKVGIFGLLTDEVVTTSNTGPNLKMIDAVQTARDTVAELSRQRVNKVILLSHLGFPADKDMASKVNGIDVIVSGHTETLMGDQAKLDPSLGSPTSAYPEVVNSPDGGRTLIVHDFIWGRLLGCLNLEFDGGGQIVRWDGQPIFVDRNINDDPVVAQRLTELAGPVKELMKQVIGKTAVDLDGRRAVVRNQESNLGDLVADAMLWSTRGDKTQVAIASGGGIRSTIKAGDITVGQVLEALPFGNRLVQFDLSGADLLAALENGLSQIEPDPEASAGRFPQVGGIKFSADWMKPVGSRVIDVQIGTAASGYKPLDKAAAYRIVSLDFMYNGGDGYTMFKKGRNLRGGDVPQEMALIDYIKANSPVNPGVEGRINLASR